MPRRDLAKSNRELVHDQEVTNLNRHGSLPQSRGPTAAERAVGARLEICINIVDIGHYIRVLAEALHDREPSSLALEDNAPKSFDLGQSVNQRRAKCRAKPIRSVTVIARGMITPEPVVGPRIDLAINHLI
jgi:hypothetical protein